MLVTPLDIARNWGELLEEPTNVAFYDHELPFGAIQNKHWKCLELDSCEVEFGDFLWGLTRYLKPDIVVETGTCFGFSMCCVGLALKENGRGKIFSAEINSERCEISRRHVASLGLGDFCEVIEVCSLSDDFLHLFADESIDFLFLDGGSRVLEYEKLYSKVRAGGLIGLHDSLKFKEFWDFVSSKGGLVLYAARGAGFLQKGKQKC